MPFSPTGRRPAHGDPWKGTSKVGPRVDWKAERDRIDLEAVVTRYLGEPSKRRNGRAWWPCPFHKEESPSFFVKKKAQWWGCYGCGERGDAVTFVMRSDHLTFPEAVALLTGGPMPTRKAAERPAMRPAPKAPPEPSGLPEAAALALVDEAAARLWSPEGADALAYLTGPGRCLTPETIRAARLGWTPKAAGVAWKPPGVVIPWFVGGPLALVKVRPPAAWRERFPRKRRPPKYLEAYRDPARLVCYPGPGTIRPGRPLVVVEGEFDALCLAQELKGLAAVVTLGSASARPTPAVLGTMLAAAPWFVATDEDEAGDRAAARWPAPARRVRPPGSFKDWTEAMAGGVDLARWWRDVLAGTERPPLFSWDELARWRWGDADEAPGIDNPGRRPSPEFLAQALDPASDPEFLAEREGFWDES